jgi:hypothetical protein
MANFYQYVLKAGVEYQAPQSGRLIVVDSVDGAAGVDITPMLNNGTGRTMPSRKKGFKCWVDFDAVVLKAATDCTVSLFLSTSDVSLGFTDGSAVSVSGGVSILNAGDQRVPVDIAGANVQVTATNVGINNADANPVPVRAAALSTLTNGAPVAIGAAAAQFSGDATLRRLRVRNSSATLAVAIGGPNVTLGNAAIVLQPGDVWLEDDAAGAAWYGIASQAGATLCVMGMK